MEQRPTHAALLLVDVMPCFFRNTLLRGDLLYCVKLLEWSLLSLTLVAIFLLLSCVF
jgi:hypothetical protein